MLVESSNFEDFEAAHKASKDQDAIIPEVEEDTNVVPLPKSGQDQELAELVPAPPAPAAAPKKAAQAAGDTLSLTSPEVGRLQREVDKYLVERRKGCALPDSKPLNFPVTHVTKFGSAIGAKYVMSFGYPLKPSTLAFRATVLMAADDVAVKDSVPEACSITRNTEDSPEQNPYVNAHQRAVADQVAKLVSIKRAKCGKSTLNLPASKIIATSEQMVAGTEYIFRMQLQDSRNLKDVVTITALLPPATTKPTDVKILKTRPSACQLFPTMEVPIEAKAKAKAAPSPPLTEEARAEEETAQSEEQAYEELDEESDYVKNINDQNLSWKATQHSAFKGLSFEKWHRQFTGLDVGGLEDPKNQMLVTTMQDSGQAIAPAHDWRKAAPKCVNTERVRNQGGCGSCYAFAKTGILSHRICIASKGTKMLQLSPRYMASCPYEGLNGCGGGVPKYSGKFLIDKGVPSERCVPYHAGSLHTYCRNHCKPFRTATGKVMRDPWEKYHAKEGSHARVVGERQMQLAILNGGPIEGTIKVFPSFKAYHSGVYFHPEPPRCSKPTHLNCCVKHRYCFRFTKHTWDKKTKKMKQTVVEKQQKSSGHAFMIVGWGSFPAAKGAAKEEEFVSPQHARKLNQWHVNTKATARFPAAGKKYWICENSWGKKWGHGGFFLVERGIDTAFIESMGAYTLQPGHKVLYKHNSRCKCNAHGDLALKGNHIITGEANKKLANKCKCDLGWGGDKCQSFCADSHAKGSQFCSSCNQQGDCLRCRSGQKASEKQVLGNGMCWTKCSGDHKEANRLGGKCFSDKTWPCTNSKTKTYDYKENKKCACKPGWGGARCQYPSKCLAFSANTCSSCSGAKLGSCATPSCGLMKSTGASKKAATCVAACSGNGFKVMGRYASRCACKDGFSGNNCQLDCSQANKKGVKCLTCSADGVCLATQKTVLIKSVDGKECIRGDFGATVGSSKKLAVVKNDFSVSFWMKGSHWSDAHIFKWYGSTVEAGTHTDDYNTGQIAQLKNRKEMLGIGARYFKKSAQGELLVTYGGGTTPVTFSLQLKNGVTPGQWTHISVTIEGLRKSITAYINGKPAGAFKLAGYPANTIDNEYTVAPGGFWGYAHGVRVSNTAVAPRSKDATAPKCVETCAKSCKGTCMFGKCVCKHGSTGPNCDVAAAMATFSSGPQSTKEAMRHPKARDHTGKYVSVRVPVKAPPACKLSAADISHIDVTFAIKAGYKPTMKCYRLASGAKSCHNADGTLHLEKAVLQVFPPGSNTPVTFAQGREIATFLGGSGVMMAPDFRSTWKKPKTLRLRPGWKLGMLGAVQSGVWRVAVTKRSKFVQGTFSVSPAFTMSASISLKTTTACAATATTQSKTWPATSVIVPPPVNLCFPAAPCGVHGICSAYSHAGKHSFHCECKTGWSGKVCNVVYKKPSSKCAGGTFAACMMKFPNAVFENCMGCTA